MSAPRGTCVIGMHRSGTSLVANLIAELDIELGPVQEMLGPAATGENPRGYWEQREIMNLNDVLLSHLGGGWYDIVGLPRAWEVDPELDELYSRARALISELFGEEGRWAFKDPRASLTLPFWLRVAGPLDSVICVRDPAAVASSLEERDGLAHPRWRSSAIWLAYTAYALEHSRGQPRAVVHYEEVMRDPSAQLERLGRFLEVEVKTDAMEAAAERTVDESLWHHRADGEEASDPYLLPEAVELYRILRSEPDHPDLEARAADLRRSGLARVGPVTQGRLAPLRATAEGIATDSERVDPESMSRSIGAGQIVRYRIAAHLAVGRDVLDAGCGYGYGTGLLAAAGATRAVGIDVSEEAIREAQAHEEAHFEVGDIASLPFDEDSFDLVTCYGAIERVVRREETLDELTRVLRPDGLLFISTPNRLRYRQGNPHHVYEYEPEEFRDALQRRFKNIQLLRQYILTATIVRSDGNQEETTLDVPEHGSGAEPGREIYTLAVASSAALPAIPTMSALLSPDDPDSPENVALREQELSAFLQHRDAELQQRNQDLQRRNQALQQGNQNLKETNTSLHAKNQEIRAKLQALEAGPS